jgi:hypothetical protein
MPSSIETKEYMRAYYQEHKEKWLVYNKTRRERNPKREREYKRKSRAKRKEQRKVYNKMWAQKNAGKVTAYARAYQLAKKRAMPTWLTDVQVKQIEDFYANRPAGYHVDHIMPIKGKNSCGLHVPWNLQYLPATENVKKSNKEPSLY